MCFLSWKLPWFINPDLVFEKHSCERDHRRIAVNTSRDIKPRSSSRQNSTTFCFLVWSFASYHAIWWSLSIICYKVFNTLIPIQHNCQDVHGKWGLLNSRRSKNIPCQMKATILPCGYSHWSGLICFRWCCGTGVTIFPIPESAWTSIPEHPAFSQR
jgi:hypothetical protein